MRSFPLFPALALTLALAVTLPAVADEPAPPAPAAHGTDALRLDLDEAVSHALARHPALAAAAHARTGADARVAQARTAWLPRVGAEAGYRYAGPLPELAIEPGITLPGAAEPLVIARELGTEHSAHVSATVGWRAWDFGARDAAIEAAEAGVEATAAERAERAADIAYAVRASYLAVLLAEESAAVTKRSLGTARQERDEAEIRRAAGIGNDLAVAGAGARAAELEARLVEARQARARAFETLRSLLGVPPGAPLTLSARLADEAAAAPTGDEGETAEAASHPTIDRLTALERATDRQRDGVARTFLPTIDLYGNVGYQFPHTFVDDDVAGFVWAAGVTVSWSAFDGGLRDRREDELVARSHEVATLRDAAREDIERSAIDARTRFESARATAAAATRSREAAEVYLDAARTALDAGTATALDVLEAEAAVDGAHLAEVKARFDGALAHAALLRAQGRTLRNPRITLRQSRRVAGSHR